MTRCVVCNAKIEARHGNAKTCSEPCRVVRERVLRRADYDKNREAIRQRRLEYFQNYNRENREAIRQRYYAKVRSKPKKVKSCVVCGAKFELNHGNSKTCSEPCRVEQAKLRFQLNRVRLRDDRKNREVIHQRELERRRKARKPSKVRSGVCVICGAGFELRNRNAKFCSNPCRVEQKRIRDHQYNHDYWLKNREAISKHRRLESNT
jgi:predicted nucleic acid-binding Zn ribbon protein